MTVPSHDNAMELARLLVLLMRSDNDADRQARAEARLASLGLSALWVAMLRDPIGVVSREAGGTYAKQHAELLSAATLVLSVYIDSGDAGVTHADMLYVATTLLSIYADPTSARAIGERLRAASDILQTEYKNHDLSAAEALARTVAPILAQVRAATGATWEPPTEDGGERLLSAARLQGPPERDGMLAFDSVLAETMRTLGTEAVVAADAITKSARLRWSRRDDAPARDLWKLWLPKEGGGALEPSTPSAIANLLKAVWFHEVLPKLERAAAKPPALVRAVHASAMEFHSSPKLHCFNKDTRTLSFEGRDIARTESGANVDVDVIVRGLDLLGSVAAHRLLRWEVITAHDRHLSGEAYPNILEVEGGWSGLARLLGLNPDKPKVTSDLRSIVYAQGRFHFKFPDGSHGTMLSHTERPAKGRTRRARVTITLGPPLLPGYTDSLRRGSPERKLVPMLREAPPLYGRPNEHGQQMTMSLAVMAELRERATELASEGGVCFSLDDWTRLADRSGVPRRLAVPVRDHWLVGDTHAKPFLMTTGRDRFTLADAHTNERAFLEEAGRDEAVGRARGRKAVAVRRAKRARLARKPT